jgi:aspartyl-tRNA(Asn)/glutamyl-tRNA(Gln) amidotransferase subunit B
LTKKAYTQVSDTKELEQMIDTILIQNPTQVADYKSGKVKLFGFFVGAVMKQSKGPSESRCS